MFEALLLATNVRVLLGERGWTTKELAERAGVSPSFLSDLMNAKANPSLRVMLAVAGALGVRLAFLIEHHDLDVETAQQLAAENPPPKRPPRLPPGYRWVNVALPEDIAVQVGQWGRTTMARIGRGDPPK